MSGDTTVTLSLLEGNTYNADNIIFVFVVAIAVVVATAKVVVATAVVIIPTAAVVVAIAVVVVDADETGLVRLFHALVQSFL